MRVLWAPWRLAYVEKSGPDEGCIFCEKPRVTDAAERKAALVLHATDDVSVMMNRFPYANAHVMVAPREHTADFAGMDETLASALTAALQRTIAAVQRAYTPQGLNVGLNLGRVAGAGFPGHIHWHVVPRWEGDTNFMPLFAETKVIPQHIEETYDRLLPFFEESE